MVEAFLQIPQWVMGAWWPWSTFCWPD